MIHELSCNEEKLVGNWIEDNGSVVQDVVCDRIQQLIGSYLEEIVVDGEKWTALYRNPHDGSYWELTYPQSHMHGAGPPMLQRVSDTDAHKKYHF